MNFIAKKSHVMCALANADFGENIFVLINISINYKVFCVFKKSNIKLKFFTKQTDNSQQSNYFFHLILCYLCRTNTYLIFVGNSVEFFLWYFIFWFHSSFKLLLFSFSFKSNISKKKSIGLVLNWFDV
jgi:hypothetical protein